MACEDNDINRMQELLQARCPVGRCEVLWRHEERAAFGGFEVRIVLTNTGLSSDADMPMPWSAAYVRKMDAKKAAARICLEHLEQTGAHPHDPSQLALAVGISAGASTGGGGGAAGVEATLPALQGLLDVTAVIMTPVASGDGSATGNATSTGTAGEVEEHIADGHACACGECARASLFSDFSLDRK